MATPLGPVCAEVFARTDIGKVRESNQDFFLIGDLDTAQERDLELADTADFDDVSRGPLLVVCDGMGGVAGGDVASQLAARVLWAEMRESPDTDERPVFARILRRSVRVANRRVNEEGRNNRHLVGMGTTLSAAGICGDALLLAQVGDSRAYVRRGVTLTQVTRDQSIVSALMHAGRITESEARESPRKNMILQALGASEDVDVSLSIVELRRGDRLLLCSDGLHGPVPHSLLERVMISADSVHHAVDQLVDMARAAGGPDNITAVVAEFTGEGLRPPMSPEDLPRFVEFSPLEGGDRALATTSWVARRLAARAGLVDDPGPEVVPATGQHTSLSETARGAPVRAERRRGGAAGSVRPRRRRGPAAEAFDRSASLGVWPWLVAGLVMLALALVLLGDVL